MMDMDLDVCAASKKAIENARALPKLSKVRPMKAHSSAITFGGCAEGVDDVPILPAPCLPVTGADADVSGDGGLFDISMVVVTTEDVENSVLGSFATGDLEADPNHGLLLGECKAAVEAAFEDCAGRSDHSGAAEVVPSTSVVAMPKFKGAKNNKWVGCACGGFYRHQACLDNSRVGGHHAAEQRWLRCDSCSVYLHSAECASSHVCSMASEPSFTAVDDSAYSEDNQGSAFPKVHCFRQLDEHSPVEAVYKRIDQVGLAADGTSSRELVVDSTCIVRGAARRHRGRKGHECQYCNMNSAVYPCFVDFDMSVKLSASQVIMCGVLR